MDDLSEARHRAKLIAEQGSVAGALAQGKLDPVITCTASEGLILGLLNQGVRKYLAVFGHGSTTFGEYLRIYEEAGVVRTFAFHNEVAMAHAATALKWHYGETPAVVTSIGPGALQAIAGSLTAITNSVGLYHIYGDETTFGEGPNLQQIPKAEQASYSRITAIMGQSYLLHTPEALRDLLKKGASRVFHPYRPGPFYVHLPMNVQPATIGAFNLRALPGRAEIRIGPSHPDALEEAMALVRRYERITIKAGGGARGFGPEISRLAEAVGAAVVIAPVSHGLMPDHHPNNMLIGGGKGSIPGNFAMANAELVIVAGSRGVCQADCSSLGYERAEAVININASPEDALRYNRTIALVGDIGLSVAALADAAEAGGLAAKPGRRAWLDACATKKAEWRDLVDALVAEGARHDPRWGRKVLTQVGAIKAIADFSIERSIPKFFDAGDVQTNAMQLCADPVPGLTLTDGGASYMGFSASALVAGGLADAPRYAICVTGDGSFWMNPQVLVNAVEHGARGCVVILDNRRMGAISTLQAAQYGKVYRTSDGVEVDYLAMAGAVRGVKAIDGGTSRESLLSALSAAVEHPGLAVIHVPVLWDESGAGNIGSYGRWNVGSWCDDAQRDYLAQDL